MQHGTSRSLEFRKGAWRNYKTGLAPLKTRSSVAFNQSLENVVLVWRGCGRRRGSLWGLGGFGRV